ncbi:hypothetical protein CKO14_08500 [Halorhodospira halophila]|nr:hypothetical protein [Halorhodospira halophila]
MVLALAAGSVAVGAGQDVAPSPGSADRPSYVGFYVGQSAQNRLVHIVSRWSASRQESYLVGLVYGTRVARWGALDWEVEGQLARHTGMQRHGEVNGVLVARWTRFPWDRWLDTRAAFGEGLSWATQEPRIEPRGDKDDDEDSAQLLNYLLLEIEGKPPGRDWSGFVRIHHRSGVFGLFSGVRGGSNFVGAGVRRYFRPCRAQKPPV